MSTYAHDNAFFCFSTHYMGLLLRTDCRFTWWACNKAALLWIILTAEVENGIYWENDCSILQDLTWSLSVPVVEFTLTSEHIDSPSFASHWSELLCCFQKQNLSSDVLFWLVDWFLTRSGHICSANLCCFW